MLINKHLRRVIDVAAAKGMAFEKEIEHIARHKWRGLSTAERIILRGYAVRLKQIIEGFLAASETELNDKLLTCPKFVADVITAEPKSRWPQEEGAEL